MDMIYIAVGVLFVVGLVIAGVLAFASRLFYVEEDPVVAAIAEMLPAANCGGCGYAGCSAYAEAVVKDPDVPANRCCVGGAELAAKIAAATGKAAGDSTPHFSFRLCNKCAGNVKARYEYAGIQSCAAAALVDGGPDMCAYSCLGFGDCVKVCNFCGIEIVDGMASISPNLCTGCGACINACPRGVLKLMPGNARVMVSCSSLDKLKDVADVCEFGCIKCQRCVKTCPAKAISLKDGRIEIDHKACLEFGDECEMACLKSCARHTLHPVYMTVAATEEAKA